MKSSAIVFMGITVLALAGCGGESSGRKASGESTPVRVMAVENKDLSKTLEYAGSIKGRDEAVVYPKVNGKVIEKTKEEGSRVDKGEPIMYIDRDEVGLKFERAPVESPLAGVLGRVYVDIGSSVTPQTAVAIVSDMSAVRVELDIPERYVPKLSVGTKAAVSVDAYPDTVFGGAVLEISSVMDLATRSAPIKIAIDDPGHLLMSGMFAKVKIPLEAHTGVPVVPREAIVGKEPQAYVFVVEGGKASLKSVTTGMRSGPDVEITGGVTAGEKVVIVGQQRLRDGATVVAEE